MSKFFVIWWREFSACFLSPVAYVTMVIFLAASGVTFVAGIEHNAGTTESALSLLFGAQLIWLTFLVSVVCMRLFSEERRSGTLETLATAPVNDAQIVIGKYMGGVSFLGLVSLPALLFVFILDFFSPGIDGVDIGSMLSGYLMLLLIIFSCTALGVVISLLTRNMIVSFVAISCGIWCFLLFGYLLDSLPGLDFPNAAWAYAVMEQLDAFSRGSIDLRAVVMHVSLTVFLLFVSVRLLESRRWL